MMCGKYVVLFVAMFSAFSFGDRGQIYRNHSVVHLKIADEPARRWLHHMATDHSEDIDILKEGMVKSPFALVVVSPALLSMFVKQLIKHNIAHTIVHNDYQKIVQKESDAIYKRAHLFATRFKAFAASGLDLENYNSYADIQYWCNNMTKNSIVTKISIGTSYEGRNITAIKIGLPTADGGWKKMIFVEAGIHAREWQSPAATIWAADRIISGALQPPWKSLLRLVDIVIVPVSNPDGYEYSRAQKRLWRKTRSCYPKKSTCIDLSRKQKECVGVDLNRNFGFHWAEGDSYLCEPCDSGYPGAMPFSENETRAIRDFVQKHPVQAYLSVHAFSKLLMAPWAYSKTAINPNNEKHNYVAKFVLKALRENGTGDYEYGSAANVIYEASGVATDYMHAHGVPIAFAVELPPTSVTVEESIRMSWQERSKNTEDGFAPAPQNIPLYGRDVYLIIREIAAHAIF